MTPEQILDALADAGIVETDPQADRIAFSEAFAETADGYVESLAASNDVEAVVRENVPDEPTAAALLDRAGENTEFLSYSISIIEYIDEPLPVEDLVRLVLSVYQLRDAPSYPEHVPDRFLSIEGDWLNAYLTSSERAIVFLWRRDCPECELVRDDLDELLDGRADDIGLFAVYGTPHAAELRRRFNVVGAPTLLFVVNGRIDARMQGPPQPSALENEIDYLLDDG